MWLTHLAQFSILYPFGSIPFLFHYFLVSRVICNLSILVQYPISITPENVRKPKVFCFQGVLKWNIGLKWVKRIMHYHCYYCFYYDYYYYLINYSNSSPFCLSQRFVFRYLWLSNIVLVMFFVSASAQCWGEMFCNAHVRMSVQDGLRPYLKLGYYFSKRKVRIFVINFGKNFARNFVIFVKKFLAWHDFFVFLHLRPQVWLRVQAGHPSPHPKAFAFKVLCYLQFSKNTKYARIEQNHF